MMENNKVVVTGVGVISPIGNSKKEFWSNLIEGKSGIKNIEGFDTTDLPTHFGGEVKKFNPFDYPDNKSVKKLSRYIQVALAANEQAIKDAELEITDSNRDRIGVYIGSGACGFGDYEYTIINAYNKGWKTIPFYAVSLDCNNSPSYSIACRYGITGPSMTVSTACTSGSHALEVAQDQIRLGKVDVAIVIGSEVLSEFIKFGKGFNDYFYSGKDMKLIEKLCYILSVTVNYNCVLERTMSSLNKKTDLATITIQPIK